MKKLNHKFIIIFSYIINLIFVFYFYISQTGNHLDYLYNADILYFPTLFKDLFQNGYTLQGWVVPAAPNFFPDMVLYFILMGITNNVCLSAFLFSIIQLLLILFISNQILKTVFKINNNLLLTLSNLCLTLFLLSDLISNQFYFAHLIITNTYHLGAFLISLLAIHLAFRYFESRKLINLIFLFIIILLSSLSDKLFIIYYSIPFSFVILILLNKRTYKKYLIVFSVNLTATILSQVIFNALIYKRIVSITGIYEQPSKEYIMLSIDLFIEVIKNLFHSSFITALILIISLISLTTAIIFLLKNFKNIFRTKSNTNQFQYVFIIYYITFFFIVLITPILLGIFDNSRIRYNICVFYFSVLLFPSFISLFVKINYIYLLNYFSLIVLVFLFIFIIYFPFKHSDHLQIKNITDYYPPYIECLDEMIQKHNLKYGISTYWYAKPITLFSKTDARVYTKYDYTMQMYPHVGNNNWYFNTDHGKYNQPVFNFMFLLKNEKLDLIREYIGEPLLIKECGGFNLIILNDYIYDRSTTLPAPIK